MLVVGDEPVMIRGSRWEFGILSVFMLFAGCLVPAAETPVMPEGQVLSPSPPGAHPSEEPQEAPEAPGGTNAQVNDTSPAHEEPPTSESHPREEADSESGDGEAGEGGSGCSGTTVNLGEGCKDGNDGEPAS